MTSLAVSLLGLFGCQARTLEYVLSVCHGFQVVWSDTQLHFTLMIDHQPWINGAVLVFVGPPVRWHSVSSASLVEAPVLSVSPEASSSPQPTRVRLVNLSPESFLFGHALSIAQPT